MQTPRRTATLVALLGASVMSMGCNAGSLPSPEPAGRVVAAVYRGPAACDGCPEAVADVLVDSGEFTVEFIGGHEDRAVTREVLETVSLYVQPGGFDDVGLAMTQLGTDATDAIASWVEDGGRYVGFCMGAYLAGSAPGMGLLSPGDTAGYAGMPGSLVFDGADTVLPVDWDGQRRYQYAQEAAVIEESGVDGERVLSRYTNGAVNALVRPVGDGAVGVVGTHPEAGDDWFTPELAEADIDGPDHEQALQLVDAVMQLR